MSGSIRLFVREDLQAAAAIPASPGQAHYLGTVMRRDAGGSVRLFNGRDGEWQARIATLRRYHAIFEVETKLRPQEAEADIWLVFAALKRDATELVVQKATELGCSALLPVLTERTVTGRINAARLVAIATEAAEQCERLSVPALQDLQSLAATLDHWARPRPLLAATERSGAAFLPSANGVPCALLVGPEGGFAPGELDALRSRPFVVPVSLGPRILRAETAAIAGLALLQAPPGRRTVSATED